MKEVELPNTLERPRVLLVDDDVDHTEILTLVLRNHFPKCTVTRAHSVEETRSLNALDYDIALVDLNLQDGSGIDILKILTAHHDLPVILVTGERFGEPAAEAIRAGAADYLVKHGDYLHVLPAVVRKTLAMAEIKAENRRLQTELLQRNADLETLNEELHRVASHDPLTGLCNRRHFNELFHQLFAESDRYGSDLTCVMIDLDGFKGINDRLGHQAGDRVLILVADALRLTLRASDVAARFGGDEFVVLLPRTIPADAQNLAKRIRTSFRDVVLKKMPEAASVTLSLGVASREQHQPKTYDALIRLADDALYQAKAAGKDRIMVIRPISVDAE